VANQVKFIRIGGILRSERVAKLNRLVEIEHYLRAAESLNDCRGETLPFPLDFDIPEKYLEAMRAQEETKKPTVKK
jgi:hypothetical protein